MCEYDYYKVVEHCDGMTAKFSSFDEALAYVKKEYRIEDIIEFKVQIDGYNNYENEYYGEEWSLECWNELDIAYTLERDSNDPSEAY